MIEIITLTLGDYQTNTYIVYCPGAKTCAVIDPGYEPQTILRKVSDLGLTIEAVLLTHGHFDHVGAVESLVRATGCKLWMSQGDWSMPKNPTTAFFYPIAGCDFTEVWFCEDGEAIHAGGLTFTALSTPGHTYGSMCFLCKNALFSGDTLFFRSCGRTDLPGGSRQALAQSLERLAGLDADFTVYPGHGPATTLDDERKLNPYLR